MPAPPERDIRWIVGASLAIAVVAAVRVWLSRWLPYDPPVLVLVLVVALAGYVGGMWPALLAVVASLFLADLALVEPVGSLAIASAEDAAALGMFALVGAVVSGLAEAGWRARKEAAAVVGQLAASERRFRQTFEQAAVGMAHTALDGSWLWVNGRFAELLGYRDADDMVGRLVTEVTPGEELRRDLESARRLLAGEVSTVTRDKRYMRRDGAELWGALTLSLLRDESGQPLSFVAVVQDITQRRRAERALVEGEAYLRQLLDSTAEGIYGIDREGRCTLVNQAALKMLGYSRPDDIVGKNVHVVVHGRRADGSTYPYDSCPIAQALSKGATAALADEVLWRADGSRLRAELRAHPIVQDDVVIGGVVTFTDVGARMRAEEEREALLASERAARSEAERANRAKEEFVAVVSHELRTPLSAILGWTQILLRRAEGLPPTTAEGLRVIERNARVQSQLVSDLLDIARIMSGRFRLERHTFELAEVVRRTVETYRPQLEAHGLRFDATVPDAAGEVEGDPVRIEQVVSNLLSNALKFTPPGGAVSVVLRPRGREVELRVHDTGQGIDPEFVPQLFQRFRQADPSMTRSAGGLGLGLAIVKEIVDRHGGRIRAHSAGEGQGATFVMTLPLARTRATAPSRPEAHEGVTRLDGISILVVEDNADTREMLRTIFEERGAEVRGASDVEEALEALDHALPDVLVSDIGLPRRDGYDLIRTVRDRPVERGGRLPAIALTAMARVEDRDRALEAGYQEHVAKPVNLEVLCALIAELAAAPVA